LARAGKLLVAPLTVKPVTPERLVKALKLDGTKVVNWRSCLNCAVEMEPPALIVTKISGLPVINGIRIVPPALASKLT